MFLNLYKLYTKHENTGRIPLEDFTTEAFASILEMFPDIKLRFIKYLKLPEEEYRIQTQRRFYLKDDSDCIVDLVLEGHHTVCFIENKVHSTEGREQLNRYSKALDEHFSNQNKKLCYCTKFNDSKNHQQHEFMQFKWYDVGLLLKPFIAQNIIVESFIHFLKHHKMSQNNILTMESIITMENFVDTYEMLVMHLKNNLPNFKKRFPDKKIGERTDIDHIKRFNRICYVVKDVLNDKSNYSEILYSIAFENVKLNTQFWVRHDHPQKQKIKEYVEHYNTQINPDDVFQFEDNEWGLRVFQQRKIYDLLNSESIDVEINKWFEKSFESMSKFINESEHLSWNIIASQANMIAQ